MRLLNMKTRRIIIGISGASGFIYGVRALELLKPMGIETHLVVSKVAQITRTHETALAKDQVEALASVVYPIDDIGAAIASGAFKTMGMLVAPCSMHTLSSIASSSGNNLLTRAADVVLKERRRLVLMVRETPLHLGHLRNMTCVTEMGGVIYPPVPAMYQHIQTIDDMVTYSVARALDLFDLDVPGLSRWGEDSGLSSRKLAT